MLSHPESRIENRLRASPLRTLTLAALALVVSASIAAAQRGGGGGMCQGGGGGRAGGGASGGSGGAGGFNGGGISLGQQGGGQIGTTRLNSSFSSMGNTAAIASQQLRQAQQAHIDQMAKLRRDVQQAAQQRVQTRAAALEARLVREERLAESAAKTKALRLAASKKPASTSSNLIAATGQPTASKLSER